MYAKELQLSLHQELAFVGSWQDTQDRFESLRAYGRLPRGRESAGNRLSNEEIANAVFGFTPCSPGWAGHVALILANLRPVGGPKSYFFNSRKLGDVIAALVSDEENSLRLKSISLQMPIDTSGGDYFAQAFFREGTETLTVSFVSETACSLLGNGKESGFDMHSYVDEPMRSLALDQRFFRELARDVALSRELNRPLKTDWQEYVSEEEKQVFHTSLGARPSSKFLNMGVDTTVTWPREPTVVKFSGCDLVLFPKTKDNSHSISIDLTPHRLGSVEIQDSQIS